MSVARIRDLDQPHCLERQAICTSIHAGTAFARTTDSRACSLCCVAVSVAAPFVKYIFVVCLVPLLEHRDEIWPEATPCCLVLLPCGTRPSLICIRVIGQPSLASEIPANITASKNKNVNDLFLPLVMVFFPSSCCQ